MNHSTWVVGYLFEILEKLCKFHGIIINIKTYHGLMMGKPFHNIIRFMVGFQSGGGLAPRCKRLTINVGLTFSGGLTINQGGGFN